MNHLSQYNIEHSVTSGVYIEQDTGSLPRGVLFLDSEGYNVQNAYHGDRGQLHEQWMAYSPRAAGQVWSGGQGVYYCVVCPARDPVGPGVTIVRS